MSWLRRRWRLVAGLVVSGVFITIAMYGLKLGDFLGALQSADYVWLLPAVGVYFLGVVARTWRWQVMLRHLQTVPNSQLFRIVCIGYMGNNVYPARAGEVLRSYVLKRQYGIRVSASLATVLIERLFDGLTMLLFVFIALPLVDLAGSALEVYGRLIAVFTALFVLALVVFLILAGRPELAGPIYTRIAQWLLPERFRGSAVGALDRFMVGLGSLARGREVFLIFGTSVLVWLFETAKYWFVMHAFPFRVSFFTLMLMNGVVNLATTIPAAPGHIGTFDLPGIYILVAAGVDREMAAAYTLVLHVALWLPITLLGAIFLWQARTSMSEARAAVGAESAPPEPKGP